MTTLTWSSLLIVVSDLLFRNIDRLDYVLSLVAAGTPVSLITQLSQPFRGARRNRAMVRR